MSRLNPIQYAERLYAAIRAANFSPISFLAFGNAVKDGVEFRRMPRIAAEPFMRVVGEMLDLEDESTEPSSRDAELSPEGEARTEPGDRSPVEPSVETPSAHTEHIADTAPEPGSRHRATDSREPR